MNLSSVTFANETAETNAVESNDALGAGEAGESDAEKITEVSEEKDKTSPSPIQVQRALIVFDHDLELSKAKKKEWKDSWKRACDQIKPRLTAGEGVFGFGLATSLSCSASSKKVTSLLAKPGTAALVVRVNENSSTATLQLSVASGTAPRVVTLSSYETNLGPAFIKLLSDELYADSLAKYLLLSAPVNSFLNAEVLSEEKLEFEGGVFDKEDKNQIAPPRKLELFTTAFDESTESWFDTPLGKADLVRRKKKGIEEKGVATLRWRLERNKESKEALEKVSLRDAICVRVDDPKLPEKLQNIRSNLKKKEDSLSDSTEKTLQKKSSLTRKLTEELVTGGYVGLRYGVSLLKDYGLKDLNTFSLKYENKGKTLSGLSYNYDLWPKVDTTIDNDNQLVFSGSRHLLGWAFRLNFDSPWIDSIDFTPRVGMWTYSLRMPVAIDIDEYALFNFDMTNALTTELEGGVTWSSSLLLLRVFASRSLKVLKDKQNREISATRYGGDLVSFGLDISRLFKISLLSFAYIENISASVEDGSSEILLEQRLTEVNYSSVIAGMGVALAW